MRLIDADALKANFVVLGEFAKDLWHASTIRIAIDNAPTVDAVPVVRCKDCKHYVWDEFDGCHVCLSICKFVKPDFWCADGERRTDEAD